MGADDPEGVWGAAPSGTNQATIAPPRSTYLPPIPAAADGVPVSQASVSATCLNPAFSSRSAVFATAWYGVGLAARKDIRSSVWPRSKREGSLMGFTLTTYEGPPPVSGAGPHKGDVGFREAVPVLSWNVFAAA